MAKNIELFDLVESLNPKEIRYIKLLMKALGGQTKKKYQSHFDAILGMNTYNEIQWKRKIGHKSSKKNIQETNDYLYDFILKSLVVYSSSKEKNKDTILAESQKINILKKKGLYNIALKKIDKLIKICYEQDFYNLTLHLLNEKRGILFGLGLRFNQPELFSANYDEYESNLDKCNESNNYLRLVFAGGQLIHKHSTIRNAEIEADFQELNNHPLLKSSHLASTDRAKSLFFSTKLALLNLLYDEENAIKISNEAITYLKRKNEIKSNELNYGFMLKTRLELCIVFGRWNEFKEIFKKFNDRVPYLTTDLEHQFWFAHQQDKALSLFYAEKDIDGFLNLIDKTSDKKLELCKKTYPHVFYQIEFYTARLYHLNNDFEKALDHLNNIIKQRKDIGQDLLIASKSLYLIIHFELNNDEFLPYAIQSLYRSLLKMNTIFLAERHLIKLLKKAINISNKKDFKRLYTDTLKEWNILKSDKYQRDFFYYFPYCEWILSKIQNRPFIDVLNEHPNHPHFKLINIKKVVNI